MSQEAVEKLHPALDNDDDAEEVNNVILREIQLPEIMIAGNVAAGEIMWEDSEEPSPLFKKPVTALRVSGTSMEPEIKNGQIVVVSPIPEGDDLGKYIEKIVVYEGGDSARGITLKRLVQENGIYLLAPLNPLFQRRIAIDGKIKAVLAYKLDPC